MIQRVSFFFFNQLVTRFRVLDTRGLDALFEV